MVADYQGGKHQGGMNRATVNDARLVSPSSIERCSRYVGFAPDSGRIAAAQRYVAMGQQRKSRVLANVVGVAKRHLVRRIENGSVEPYSLLSCGSDLRFFLGRSLGLAGHQAPCGPCSL